jgi:hypothetical protein
MGVKENAIKSLRAIQAQQRELLNRWEAGNWRLWSRDAGEPETDITEATRAEMRRLAREYDALIEKIEASTTD